MADSGLDIVRRRHPEYAEHVDRWRWLLDSLEAGDRYRNAEYTGGRRNLVRHKREEPDTRVGTPPPTGGPAENPDYRLRVERTPVPTYLGEVIEAHLSEIYTKEIRRVFPDPGLEAWRGDVDGAGTSLDEWMSDTVAPILLALGQVDLYVDRPAAPAGTEVRSRADARRFGLDRVVASVVLPENLPWWDLDPITGRYRECVVVERGEGLDRFRRPVQLFRHWTAADWSLYDADGALVRRLAHPYGRVPIERVFDRRKVRCRNVGQSRYDGIAERQREVYNLASELILDASTQSHPQVQGPEDYLTAEQEIPIGPGYVLPKKKHSTGTSVTYEGWEVLDFPKGAAESIREDIRRYRDEVDRDARLTKPAGAQGTAGTTVAQSGISKALDQKGGNALLSKLGKRLSAAEWTVAGLVLTIHYPGNAEKVQAELARVEIRYPVAFNLLTAEEVATVATEIQNILANSGEAPETETRLLQALVREGLPGLEDEVYGRLDREIRAAVANRAARLEAGVIPEPSPVPAMNGQPFGG